MKVALIAVAMLVLAPTTALASSTCEAYNPQTCTTATASSGTTLPFTGIDLILLVVIATALMVTGQLLRRRLDQ